MVLVQAQDCGLLSLTNPTDVAKVPKEPLPPGSELHWLGSKTAGTPEFQYDWHNDFYLRVDLHEKPSDHQKDGQEAVTAAGGRSSPPRAAADFVPSAWAAVRSQFISCHSSGSALVFPLRGASAAPSAGFPTSLPPGRPSHPALSLKHLLQF